jgi:hypothetical protein
VAKGLLVGPDAFESGSPNGGLDHIVEARLELRRERHDDESRSGRAW